MKKILLIFLPLFIFSSCDMFNGGNAGRSKYTSGIDQGSTALCEDGYWAPTGYQNCASCSSITNSTSQSTADRKECVCNSGYYWNYGFCVTWSTTPCPTGTWSAAGYEPTGGSCTPCPTQNGTGQDTNANTACVCNTGYQWVGNSCVATTGGGQCSSGQWSSTGNAPGCAQCPDSSNGGVGTGQDISNTACECDSSHQWSTSSCVPTGGVSDDDLLLLLRVK